MTDILDFEVTCEVTYNLDMLSLLCLGMCDRSRHSLTTKLADDRMLTKYKGVQPFVEHYHGIPFWKSLTDALHPNILHFMYCGRNPDCTRLLNFVLNTASCWFVEFEITVMPITNGMPCVGLVDASMDLSAEEREFGMVSRDLSRQSQMEGQLAVSFSPESKEIFAGYKHGGSGAVRNVQSRETGHWRSMHTLSPAGNNTVKVGFLVKDRQLTFCQPRQPHLRPEWCSSGIVFEDLPDEVVPAIFLTSCVGYASVRFVDLSASPPEICPWCEDCFGASSDLQVLPSDNENG